VPIARLAAARAAINNDVVREIKKTMEEAYGTIESGIKSLYKEIEKRLKKN
jgi:hypothetical protein